MREFAHTFGTEGKLVGIVNEPALPQRRQGAPAVLFANVGMHHRVGPYRLFVDLARGLGKLGFTSMRFDLSGLGDSGRPMDGGDENTRWVEDLKSAMALLRQKHGIERFVIVGRCSGVDPAHALTMQDERIAGAVFVDDHSFETRMHYVHRYVMRATKLRPWELFLKRRVPKLFGIEKERIPASEFDRPPMTRAQFTQDLASMLEREIPLLFAFSGEYNDVFSHEGQFHDMVRPLDTRGKVDVAIYPRADHTFSIPEDRKDFIGRLSRWMSEKFPLAEPVPVPVRTERISEIPPMSGVRMVEDDADPKDQSEPRIRLVG